MSITLGLGYDPNRKKPKPRPATLKHTEAVKFILQHIAMLTDLKGKLLFSSFVDQRFSKGV